MPRLGVVFIIYYFGLAFYAYAQQSFPIANQVRNIIEAPADRLDYATAKIMLDKLVDPSIDVQGTIVEIDRMAGVVKQMIATIPKSEQGKSIERLKALKAFIYQAGHWNDNRPFEYDLDDPYGQDRHAQLLSNYLVTRKGNCISMPSLFLALGERLDLDLSLSTAPLHVMIKYTDDQTGKTYNLETTSGAGFTRESSYHKKSPMTETAISNGVYLKHLSRQEVLAVMAMTVVEHLIDTEQFDEAIAVSDVILKAYPAYAHALAKKGSAYGHLLRTRFIERYPNERDIPKDQYAHALHLSKKNQLAFKQAEQLGWRSPQLN